MDVARDLLQLVKAAEAGVVSRKGPAGTAAGTIAFPKGKEIVLSMLKRYRRTLSPADFREGHLREANPKRARMAAATGAIAAAAFFGCITVLTRGSIGPVLLPGVLER